MTKNERKIKDLQKEIKRLRLENQNNVNDRDLYRTYLVNKFKWFVQMNSENKTPVLPWLIEDMTKTFNKAQKFYWF